MAVADVFPQHAPAPEGLAAALFATEHAAVSGGLRRGPRIVVHLLLLDVHLYLLLRLFRVTLVLFAFLDIRLLLLDSLGPLQILGEGEDVVLLGGVSCNDPSILQVVVSDFHQRV